MTEATLKHLTTLNRLHNDCETRSESNLLKEGAYKYSLHPSTEVLCWGYYHPQLGIRGLIRKEHMHWSMVKKHHPEFVMLLLDDYEGPLMMAHNNFFERCIYFNVLVKKYGWPEYDVKRNRCTAAKAAAMGLPRNLEGVGAALKLPVQKDMEGHFLMLKMCKPRQSWKKTGTGPKWHEDQKDLERLYVYCMRDVDTEHLVDEQLPDLSPFEQDLWHLDQAMNWRGIRLDRKSIHNCLSMIEVETKRLKGRTNDVSMGLLDSTSQREKLLNFLRAEEVKINGELITDIKAATLDALIKEGNMSGLAKELVGIRKALGKTSTAKFKAMVDRMCEDDRARDVQRYHAAGTGRFGGQGIQFQNFPRGVIDDIIPAIDEVLVHNDASAIEMIYGDLMSFFSSILRGMLIPTEGHELFAVDYNAIEVRVLFWLADNRKGLQHLRNGSDLYCELASKIYKTKVTKKDKSKRFVGKEAVLGCGYGMGAAKFQSSVNNKGQEIDLDLSKLAVKTYREENKEVVMMWGNLEACAILAVKSPGKKYRTNKTTWFKEGRFLFCELPSGRRLAYCDPFIRNMEVFKKVKPVLHFWGVNSTTKKWAVEKAWGGLLCENVCQAVSRDLTADAMLKMEAAGLTVLLTVHDEIVPEAPIGQFEVHEVEDIMLDLPEWAEGLPVTVEGFKSHRYKK